MYVTKQCGMCGMDFQTDNTRRLYCSKPCQNAAKRRSVAEFVSRKKTEKARVVLAPKHNIAEVLAYAEQCRIRLGRYVSYGEAVALMEGSRL